MLRSTSRQGSVISALRTVGSAEITHWTPVKDGMIVDILSSES
jgi:hypothetical protein